MTVLGRSASGKRDGVVGRFGQRELSSGSRMIRICGGVFVVGMLFFGFSHVMGLSGAVQGSKGFETEEDWYGSSSSVLESEAGDDFETLLSKSVDNLKNDARLRSWPWTEGREAAFKVLSQNLRFPESDAAWRLSKMPHPSTEDLCFKVCGERICEKEFRSRIVWENLNPYYKSEACKVELALPGYFTIGYSQAGTSFTYGCLRSHPQVVPTRIKEVSFGKERDFIAFFSNSNSASLVGRRPY